MKKVIAFAGSNSSRSINHVLINFAASHISNSDTRVIKLTDYELPMFSEDLERSEGYSLPLKNLYNEIREADGLILSVNEYNGTVSAYFKNVIDWLSRIDRQFLAGKKILLMSTSSGKRGAASALEYTKGVLPRFGGEIVESFSFPSFAENFSAEEKSITNEVLLLGFIDVIQNFMHQLEK